MREPSWLSEPLAGDRVLLVLDDDPEILLLVSQVAQAEGFTATMTGAMDQFQMALTSGPPDIVLLDLALEDGDGIEALRELSNRRYVGPVILMSGCEPRLLDTAYRLGQERGLRMLGQLAKPFRLPELRGLLKQVPRRSEETFGKELSQAIVDRQLILHYQPKVRLGTGTVCSVEALVRWPHPRFGLIMPDRLIPLAENFALMPALFSWVLETSLKQSAAWRAQGIDLPVAVNITSGDLANARLLDEISMLCELYDTPDHRLILEVTESQAMDDTLEGLETLTRLRIRGIELAVDDFGTGHSSLRRLQHLPVSEIKIDRSFVTQCLNRPDDQVIVRSIIDLGHNLGMKVVAEGVEDRETYDLLQLMGCDMAQGFLLGRPVAAADLAAWLVEHGKADARQGTVQPQTGPTAAFAV